MNTARNENDLNIVICPGCGDVSTPDSNNTNCWQCENCEYEANPTMPTVREILAGNETEFNDVNLHKFSTALIQVLVNTSWR